VFLSSLELPPEGTFKLNVDGNFLESSGCLNVGGNHNGDKIAIFSHYKVEGDTLLAKLRAIQTSLYFCHNKGYNNIIRESDCLKAVDPFVVDCNHTLHTYATTILYIKDVLHENDNTTLPNVLREHNKDKVGSNSRCSTHWEYLHLVWSHAS